MSVRTCRRGGCTAAVQFTWLSFDYCSVRCERFALRQPEPRTAPPEASAAELAPVVLDITPDLTGWEAATARLCRQPTVDRIIETTTPDSHSRQPVAQLLVDAYIRGSAMLWEHVFGSNRRAR